MRTRTAREAAEAVAEQLRTRGHVAWFAGGCVRDMLLGRTPKDYDVVTDARPEEVLKLFPAARKVGAKFGVILVRRHGHHIEVATFRCEGEYSDGRRPDTVQFSSDIEDAQRRDFTINGMFLDPVSGVVIDHVGGGEDIQRRVIRTIGDADQRFAEDHLRMLRAVRLATALEFEISPSTMDAIRHHAASLTRISTERIWLELEQILTHPRRAHGWRLLRESGLRPCLCSEWPEQKQLDDLGERRLGELPTSRISAGLALATVLCDFEPAQVRQIGRALKLSNALIEHAAWLVRSMRRLDESSELELADLKLMMASPYWNELLELYRSDLAAREHSESAYRQLREQAAQIPPEDVSPAPLLSGTDLIRLGVPQGPGFGRLLRAVYRAQLNGQIRTPEEATKMAIDELRIANNE